MSFMQIDFMTVHQNATNMPIILRHNLQADGINAAAYTTCIAVHILAAIRPRPPQG